MVKTAFAAIAATALLSGAAEAQSMRAAGTLTCTVDPGVGLVLGSVRGLSCTYDHLDRRGRTVRETYMGTMNRAGVDLGVTSAQTVMWTVATPGGRSHRGMLSGTFGGSSADATVVVGTGTQSLFSEVGQPVNLTAAGNSGLIGLGVGFGPTALQLRRIPGAVYTSLR